jgi:hypothetical protein
MIQIDDAGSGSFVGGTCIAVYRRETNEYYFDIIPIELYSKENFKNRFYLIEVVNIVSTAFKLLNVKKSECIEICRGYMFEKLNQWLSDSGYNWYSTHICGNFQDIVEKNFELYTVKLGLPRDYIKYTKYPFHFHKLLKWVYSDFDNRISDCKVGWKCWEKLEGIKPTVAFSKMDEQRFFCLKCGKFIRKGSKIKVLHYYSNRDNYVYLHSDC